MVRFVVRVSGDADGEISDEHGLLRELRDAAAQGRALPDRLDGDDVLPLDDSWLLLHELLAGTDEDGNLAEGFLGIRGEAPEQAGGEGPSLQIIAAREVAALNEFVATQDLEELQGRLELRQRATLDLYPQFWKDFGTRDMEQARMGHQLVLLKSFLADAAQRGMALIVFSE